MAQSETYTCRLLKNLGILTDSDHGECCPYCHKWDGQSHEGKVALPEEDELTYIVTPKGRIIGFCHQVYDCTPVSGSDHQVNAWLDDAIDKAFSLRANNAPGEC